MKDEQFYKYFNVNPATILSDCSYENLFRTGHEFGTDVCEHMEEEGFKCKNCSLSTPKYDYYPEIDMETLLRITLLIMPEELTNCYNVIPGDLKDNIMAYTILHVEDNEELKNKVSEVLKAHVSEYVRN